MTDQRRNGRTNQCRPTRPQSNKPCRPISMASTKRDADKLASVFHPTSELTFVNDGKVVVWSRDQWLDNVRKREARKSKGSARDDAILSFDQSGSRYGLREGEVPAAAGLFHGLSRLRESGWIMESRAEDFSRPW